MRSWTKRNSTSEVIEKCGQISHINIVKEQYFMWVWDVWSLRTCTVECELICNTEYWIFILRGYALCHEYRIPLGLMHIHVISRFYNSTSDLILSSFFISLCISGSVYQVAIFNCKRCKWQNWKRITPPTIVWVLIAYLYVLACIQINYCSHVVLDICF